MTEATKLICLLIAKGITSRRIILDSMVTDLKCNRKIAEDLMDNYREIMEIKLDILSDKRQRKLKDGL